MKRSLGRGALVLAWGFVLVMMPASQARAASTTYAITVTVVDNTTSTAYGPFTAFQGGPNDVTDPASPNALNTINIGGVAWAAFQNTTGLTISGGTSATNFPGTSAVATMSEGGTVQVTDPSNSDSYTVTFQVSQQNFSHPTGLDGKLSNSESSTISNTLGLSSESQAIQSWYDSGNHLNLLPLVPAGISTPLGSYGFTSTQNTTQSLAGPTLSQTGFPVAPSLFSLTERIVVNINGNDGSPFGAQAKDVFGGTLTLTAVPEPSSVILMLATLPMALVARGIHRRRAAAAR
jgi:hypothetical protein